MRDLLESVQTDKLQPAFEKYLPAVLNNTPVKKAAPKAVLSEGKVVTGDKTAKVSAPVQDVNNVIEIKRLAGLN